MNHFEHPGHEIDKNSLSQCNELMLHDQIEPAAADSRMDEEIRTFQSTVEEHLGLRQQVTSITAALMREDRNAPLPAAELNRLKALMGEALAVNHRILDTVAANDCWLKAMDDVENDAPGQGIRLKGVMLALSGALMLYDSYLLSVSVTTEDDRIRRFLNQGDMGYGVDSGQLDAYTRFYESIDNRILARRLMKAYQTHYASVGQDISQSMEYRYLQMLIEQSPTYAMLQSRPLESGNYVSGKAKSDAEKVSDQFHTLQHNAVGGLSRIFGNSVGMVESRKGKLYGDENLWQRLLKILRPGDILLEKTPFRLTDTFIPGHWGHAAIWVGNEDQLKSLGIWDDPLAIRHRGAIQEGRLVVEALRDGVQMNSLAHFMNIDDLAVLRDPQLDVSRQAAIVRQTLRQVGKAYDFNFNVETTDEIVCSELIYQVYTDIRWPTEKIAGRYTISPDNVAWESINNGPFKTIILYHDGKEVPADTEVAMADLLSGGK